MNCAAPVQKKSIRFRARSFVAFALTPQAPVETWLESLDRWTENSPGFFASRPVVLDLNTLRPQPDEIAAIVADLGRRGIRIYAIEADGVDSLGEELPPLLIGARAAVMDEPHGLAEQDARGGGSVAASEPSAASLTIDAPVRSGQSIFHPRGDVIVLGSVGSGSEIIAGGSIHVYGALRGRAFAGAAGDDKARIFCRRNEAELLAVDGWYLTAEDMETTWRGRAIQAFLDNGVIRVTALK